MVLTRMPKISMGSKTETIKIDRRTDAKHDGAENQQMLVFGLSFQPDRHQAGPIRHRRRQE
jgi:hypothetical protein